MYWKLYLSMVTWSERWLAYDESRHMAAMVLAVLMGWNVASAICLLTVLGVVGPVSVLLTYPVLMVLIVVVLAIGHWVMASRLAAPYPLQRPEDAVKTPKDTAGRYDVTDAVL